MPAPEIRRLKVLPRRRRKEDLGHTLGEKAVHHALDKLELVLERVIDEVGINKNAVGRTKSRVVAQEEG